MDRNDTPRKANTQIDRALHYFEPKFAGDEKTRTFVCILCKAAKNGTQKSNLLSHLRSIHPEIYAAKINIKYTSKKQMRINRLEMMHHLIELVTVNKMPLSTLLASGFQKIVEEQLTTFAEAGIPIDLNDKNLIEVKKEIHTTANNIREKIRSDVEKKCFSLSADIVSKNNQSILGIYIQYIKDGKMNVRCIGMKKLIQRHTGKYLSTVVRSCLDEYDWKFNQLISITTDNGSNMLTLLRNINDDLARHTEIAEQHGNEVAISELHIHHSEIIDIDCDDQIADILHQLDSDDQNEIDDLLMDICIDEDTDDLWRICDMACNDLPAQIECVAGTPLIFVNGINCAAHTVQLAVKDAIRLLHTDDSNVIKLARAVVKFLRKESTRNEASNRMIQTTLPAIDNETRWNSTFIMVNIF